MDIECHRLVACVGHGVAHTFAGFAGAAVLGIVCELCWWLLLFAFVVLLSGMFGEPIFMRKGT